MCYLISILGCCPEDTGTWGTGIDITDNINDKCLDITHGKCVTEEGIVAVLDVVLVNNINCSDMIDCLFILFIYENEIVYGKIMVMNKKYFTIKGKIKNYYYDKIYNIYSYFTLQKLSLDQLNEWYLMEDEEELF